MARPGDVVEGEGHLLLARRRHRGPGLRRGRGDGRGERGDGGLGRRQGGDGGDRGDAREADLLAGGGGAGAGGGQGDVGLRGGGGSSSGSSGRGRGRAAEAGEGAEPGGGAGAGGLVEAKLPRREPRAQQRPQRGASLPVEGCDDRRQQGVLDGARGPELGDDAPDVGQLAQQAVADRLGRRGAVAVPQEPGDGGGEQRAEVEGGAVASRAAEAAKALGETGEGAEALGEPPW